ncbi:MAG: nucleotidyl transferase AbiEii/AbiGii toxin family protein [Candidatus Latescibacterota bacterium]|jgi:predicted nucleotidyltransferase component of viral defense system|nr:MAG: nucleotidyl transferase AbiEii/AbiGii toxin family protein [Candidatus Latescibacterota bacterium]
MTRARPPADMAASVRVRLLNLSRSRHVEFQLMLSDFAIERLLYRLGASEYADRFVLKGAMLFKLWPEGLNRATWDLDLHGRGSNSVADVEAVVRVLCGIDGCDGIVFDAASIIGEEIRAGDEYQGVRVRLEARLADARIPVQVDVGFGDAITIAPTRESYPTLLDHPRPHVLVYPREAVVAEKLEAIVSLGFANSRMKDFYDVHVLALNFAFEGATLSKAVRATFLRRGTPIPEGEPLALTREFMSARERQIQWSAFLRRGRLVAPPDAGELADALQRFLMPVLAAAAKREPPPATWPPGGPWR